MISLIRKSGEGSRTNGRERRRGWTELGHILNFLYTIKNDIMFSNHLGEFLRTIQKILQSGAYRRIILHLFISLTVLYCKNLKSI